MFANSVEKYRKYSINLVNSETFKLNSILSYCMPKSKSSSKSSSSSTGLEENIAGMLCYVLFFITGIIFLIWEKKSRFVKFHAMQSLVAFSGLWILSMLLGWVPFFGEIAKTVIGIISLILWIVLMIKAYQHEYFKLPIAGDIAHKSSR